MAGSQDMFDAIVMVDERFHGEGYQEGYEEGSTLGIIEGRQHGTLHGAKIGSEIGCYQGFAFAWRCLLHNCAAEKDREAAIAAPMNRFALGRLPRVTEGSRDWQGLRRSACLVAVESFSGCVLQSPSSTVLPTLRRPCEGWGRVLIWPLVVHCPDVLT
ncbi:protein LTO1 homolog isoform X1 [Equus quagga]|uniref:protein LTO1 homolog isoform X1 n=1 Tax=Equus quagga TaxID=89248 RepID=UPI001EE34584|nr:protein LTO1 homolog isoform X1 [Equus quagga]